MPRYIFQQSKIWEGGSSTVAPDKPRIKIKAVSLEKAMKRLPDPDMGRFWIKVGEEP
jgi:hypothetical protein